MLAQVSLDFVSNRFELGLGRARADHEKVGKARNVTQIQYNDVLGLFVRGEFSAGFC